MIEFDFLERLIRAVDESGLDSVEIERGGTRIRVSKTPPAAPVVQGAAPAQAAAPSAGAAGGAPEAAAGGAPGEEEGGAGGAAPAREDLLEVTSPMVGTFYRAPAPDAPPYVEKGDTVSEGDTLCIIEAMKLMNELESEVSGRIVEILVDDAEPVEYGQVLFRVEPG